MSDGLLLDLSAARAAGSRPGNNSEPTRVWRDDRGQSVFTASQNPTTYTYDDCSRELTETDPDGRLLTLTYDCFGNDKTERHTVGGSDVKQVTTLFDSLGRATQSTDSVTGLRHSYVYPVDTEGGVTETLRYDAAAATSTTISRSARGQETNRQTTIVASPSNLTVTRSVDARDEAERVTQATFAGSSIFRSAYDAAGRISKQWGAGTTVAAATAEGSVTPAYTYDPDTGLESAENLPLAYPSPIANTYTYSASGRLNVATIGGVGATHTFDTAGNLTRVAEGGDGVITNFLYNAANQLTSMTNGSGQTTAVFGWDASHPWRTSQGPTQASQPITYSYNAAGRMATYHDTTSGHAVSATYAYNAAGQRTKSDVTLNGTQTVTSYTYDGITLLELAATQGSPSWKLSYLYDENGVPYGGVYREGGSQPVVFGIITDAHGDVLELTDTSGAPFTAYRYDAWGNPKSTVSQQTTLINDGTARDIANRQVLRYASYAWDHESQLYYCSARYYDPATRQWTTADPAKADGEESAYQYCGGEPVGSTDPSGECFIHKDVRMTYHVNHGTYGSSLGNVKDTFARIWVEYDVDPVKTWRWRVRYVNWYEMGLGDMWASDGACALVQALHADNTWHSVAAGSGKEAKKTWGKVRVINPVEGARIPLAGGVAGCIDGSEASLTWWAWGASGPINASGPKEVRVNGEYRGATSVYVNQDIHYTLRTPGGKYAVTGKFAGRVVLPTPTICRPA